ncbi:MAG: hypothetical protein KAR21_21020, partial [Spirochaetales bacterium]|nr:hypothetical protein [Spirochaetales bacterium]
MDMKDISIAKGMWKMDVYRRKGYFYSFIIVQMAIASLAFIMYLNFPPLWNYLPGIVLFFVLLVTGTVSILFRKKLTLYLQIVSGLGMLACLTTILTVPPLNQILFRALYGVVDLHTVFAKAGVICLKCSPFNLIWLLDEMLRSEFRGDFLFRAVRGNWQILYYLHAVSGFVFWLAYLLFLSAKDRSGDQKPGKGSYREDAGSPSTFEKRTEPLDGNIKPLYSFYERVLVKELKQLEIRRKIVASWLTQTHIYLGLIVLFCGIFGWFVPMQMMEEDIGFG